MEEDTATSKSQKETTNEVSLPGSNVNSIEQPTILQVLSPLNATEETIVTAKDNPANRVILLQQPSFEESELHNDNHDDNASDENLVHNNNSSSHKSYLEITTPTPTPTPTPTKDCKTDPHTGEIIFPAPPSPSQDNILDIESHLIETYNELLYPNEESVGINELAPIDDELQVGCSKIETNDNVRTVIEVQPAEVITKKQIEQLIETDDPLQAAQTIVPTDLSNGETNVNKEEIEKVAKKLIEDLEEEIVNSWNKNILQETLTDNTNDQSQCVGEDHLEENLAEKTDKSIETIVSTPKLSESIIEKHISFETPEKSTSEVVKDTTTTSNQKLELSENSLQQPEQSSERTVTEKTTEPICVPNDSTATITENCVETKLSEVVDQQISEVTSILDSQTNKEDSSKNPSALKLQLPADKHSSLKVVSVPSPKTALEVEERKLFIESLPHLQQSQETTTNDAEKLALDCKREYYQSLKKYLIESSTDKPPLPLQTYRWEDLRRAKERGGYPWTHLYKRPLGPNDQPEIVLMLRKSQEIRFTSESPKSHKKVRIDDQVLIQETERYIQELSEEEEDEEHHSQPLPSHQTEDLENHSLHSESFSCVSDSVLTTGKPPKSKSNRFSKVKRLFRRRRYGARQSDDAQSLPDSFTNTSLQHSLEQVPQESQQKLEAEQIEKKDKEPIYVHSKTPRCFPIMKKLKSMADRQKKHFNIKRIHLGKDEKIVLNEEPKILKLKSSPKSQRSDIPHFVEKQDSDDVLEIMELDESPSRKRRDDDRYDDEEEVEKKPQSSIVKPEEIIEINNHKDLDGEVTYKKAEEVDAAAIQPKKTPRLRREHVYEEIDHPDEAVAAAEELKFILDATSVEAIKQSLATQDTSAIKEVAKANNSIPLDRMGSSEEEPLAAIDNATSERKSNSLLAPISSIDSASSDEDRSKQHLQPVTEEETDHETIEEEEEVSSAQQIHLVVNQEPEAKSERKPSLKKEASPAPSDKKVTFSHVEDEAEPHREDIELTAEQLEATKEANKWKNNIKKYTFIILMKLLLTLRLRKRKRNRSHSTTTGSSSRLSYSLSICLTPCCCR